MGEDAVAQRDASGGRGLIRRSLGSGLPAGVLGLVVLVGGVASQGVTPAGPPPSVQQLSPADEPEVRPAPAARVRLQSPPRAATREVGAVQRRSEPPGRRGRPASSGVPAAQEVPAAADEVTPDDPGAGADDPVTGLEDCVEQILTAPGDAGC